MMKNQLHYCSFSMLESFVVEAEAGGRKNVEFGVL
jgi:hypothetical protein